jgi:hypothetical protein
MHLEPISGSRIRLPEKVQVNVGAEMNERLKSPANLTAG